MSWVCQTCHQPVAGYPAHATLNPEYRRGWCPHDNKRTIMQRYVSPGPRDPAMGEVLKEAGMLRADVNVLFTGDYAQRFKARLRELREGGGEFTSEDITSVVGMPPSHPSAVGSLLNAASKRGTIYWTGAMRQADRPNQHRALLKVWRGC